MSREQNLARFRELERTNGLQPSEQQSCDDVVTWLHRQGLTAEGGHRLSSDSRALSEGDVFVAYAFDGQHDGRDHLASALSKNVGAVLWQAGREINTDAPHRVLERLNQYAGHIAHNYYQAPSDAMAVIAITGTNGKTSSAQWLAQLLNASGQRCAIMGTLGVGFVGAMRETGFTTPQAIEVHGLLHQLREENAQAVAMEVSSHALEQGRVNGVDFNVALFTNLSRDHLDYHGGMDEYEAAKAKLFTWQGLKVAVINTDDEAGMRMAQIANANDIRVIGYGVEPEPIGVSMYLRATDINQSGACTTFVVGARGEQHHVQSRLVGQFNVMNLLGVLGVMTAMGYGLEVVVPLCADIEAAPGRMQRFGGEDTPLVVVDFAHTPDALDKTLVALQAIAKQRAGRLTCVFGCGGDRDAGKRPQMGRIAAERSDCVWVTSDNPRTENPDDILAQIRVGVDEVKRANLSVHQEVDRRLAINQAVSEACNQDVILIAGKGHEAYQDIMGVKHPYSDLEQVAAALAARASLSEKE
ncbi:UDP-N-acetylmuramoyl-L-alanyl-D-glutamate--2,6-diaminopimelate ligase [Formosimonas limnophila]|uniref:UDP-N-acetylmuramoyl-L-alanyl-D-glutamate--2,6-diaminopimelate ligase n=1 Tax=Formosimonas limnophila TaxID=1384487 RepID=A0A8J3FZW5_9BURK|nr:UDP-N-acetylmuramoyl-L-alanyl-D-glutamate--2,6-diaminopimelate ligase [Formosimonas limnophila]GHA72468.1 UDP-N-acetylmuramoyl-L-alanyl-D-glutamate--2,6-diaminopimelate ligase [Formosimonas limnophila]